MKTKLLVAMVAVLLVSGCANQTIRWNKAGGTQAEFNRDEFECQKASRQMSQMGDVYNPFVTGGYYKDCMRSRGYYAQ